MSVSSSRICFTASMKSFLIYVSKGWIGATSSISKLLFLHSSGPCLNGSEEPRGRTGIKMKT